MPSWRYRPKSGVSMGKPIPEQTAGRLYSLAAELAAQLSEAPNDLALRRRYQRMVARARQIESLEFQRRQADRL